MRRITVFAFFDSSGQLKNSTSYLLKSLCDISERVIIVVNGALSKQVKLDLGRFSNEIITRENKGFDAGAYAHVITEYLKKDELKEYDEVILCNDTFWGPFVPFPEMFEHMRRKKDSDFWGLHLYSNEVFPFIPSYFLVFSKRIVNDGALEKFFSQIKEYLVSKEVSDIYACFETYIYSFLNNQGYVSSVYADTQNISFYYSPYWAIKYGLPIMKKKTADHGFYDEQQFTSALNLIKKECDYPIDIILKESGRSEGDVAACDTHTKNIPPKIALQTPTISANKLIDFIDSNDGKVAIYGEGIFGKRIWFLYRGKIKHFQGFIVSDDRIPKTRSVFGYEVKNLKDLKRDAAIIIALDKDNTLEVLPHLRDYNVLLLHTDIYSDAKNDRGMKDGKVL